MEDFKAGAESRTVNETEFTLTPAEEKILGRLVGKRVRQLVWDLNAVYFVTDGDVLKVETLADHPGHVSSDRYDEVMFIRVGVDERPPQFEDDGEAGHWYKVVARESQILNIEVARTAVVYPASVPRHPDSVAADERRVFADAGILVTLADGVLPGILLSNSFGFATWPEVRLYTRDEALQWLRNDFALRQLIGE